MTKVSAAAGRPASHHMVIKPFILLGRASEYRYPRWVWSTVVRRPSEVYDTHRRTRLTVPQCLRHFDTIPACYRRTDRRTDGLTWRQRTSLLR